jgi:succinylarginine dihydrolase
MKAYEVNFDGLVGPTHNYSGLSYGNVASMGSVHQISDPREAARQGLLKMKTA